MHAVCPISYAIISTTYWKEIPVDELGEYDLLHDFDTVVCYIAITSIILLTTGLTLQFQSILTWNIS